LKIIDFDLAIRVEDEDEEVDEECGPEGWMAPEIENGSVYRPVVKRGSCSLSFLGVEGRRQVPEVDCGEADRT